MNTRERTEKELTACLPVQLLGSDTKITRIAAGLSGAGVYRVETTGQLHVLKVSGESEALIEWRRRANVQQLAAQAGLAPRVVHVDETRRAVLSEFVADRSFPAFFFNPQTREAALTMLGRTLRRMHDLPIPPETPGARPREVLAARWAELVAAFTLPAFVGETVQGVLAEAVPACARAAVLSHNDVNPSNLVYSGESLLLLDWDTASANDPYYDLATIAVFSRMDDATCLNLLAAYDAAPVASLPARFAYNRRLVAALCGTIFLSLARTSGHAGATGGETLDIAPSLVEFYQRLRAGTLSPATAEGQWLFGLALVKECAGLARPAI